MKPLVIIPARGGSKGVPRKNIKLLSGKPLIQYTIEAARAIFPDEVICVSTDDDEIMNVVENLGLTVPFTRPPELATDEAGSQEVLLHAISFYEQEKNYVPDIIILLQVTSPFRTAQHIREALALFDEDCEMVVSVKETKANPYYVLMEENVHGWLAKSKNGDFKRRQDCPKVWEVNGAIYIMATSAIKSKFISEFTKVRKFEINEISSHDIDTKLDWLLAEVIVKSNT